MTIETEQIDVIRIAETRETHRRLDAAIIRDCMEGMVVQNIVDSNRRWHEQRAKQGLASEITEEIGQQTIFDSMAHADILSVAIMEAQGD